MVINPLRNFLLIAVALVWGPAAAQEIRWTSDISTARKASTEYQVPVLVHFYGDNCLPCKVLEQNVYSQAEVVDTLNKFFICVRINASQDRQIAAEYGVHSWPTDVFLSPDGKTLYQGVCKPNRNDYLSTLQNIAVMNRDRNVMLAAQQSQNGNQVSSQTMGYAQPQTAAGQTPSSLASQLPPAGTQPSNSSSGPGYYTQTGVGAQQQLPASLAPNAGVTSGPMLASQQPQAVTTAVQGAGNQIAGGSMQPQTTTTTGQASLPPLERAAQLPAAIDTPSVQQTLASYPSIPAAAAAAPTATWNAVASQSRSQLTENPYYNQAAGPMQQNSQPAQQPSLSAQPGMLAQQSSLPAQPPVMANMPAVAVEAGLSVAATTATLPSTPAFGQTPATPPATQASLASQTSTTDAAAKTESKVPGTAVSFQPRQNNTPAATTETSSAQTLSGPGIDGHCPVALKKLGAWVVGQEQFAVKHRGQVYWLSSQEAMQEFLTSPDACSPMLAGYDAMVFLNEGKLVPGSTQNVLYEQTSGSIFLFSSADSKVAYEKDFDRYTTALETVLKQAGVRQ